MVYLRICDISRGSRVFFLHGHSPNSEYGVDLIELVAFETQLFSHARHIRIVEVCAIKIVQKVHETAECEDEEVELLHQLALAWRILVASKIGDEAVGHFGDCYLKVEMLKC